MSTTPRKPDLTETSPMDPSAVPPPSAPGGNGSINNPPPEAPPTPGGPDDDSRDERFRKDKQATNIDTIIGRLVVDQGLATSEEVHQVFEQVRAADDPNQRSLSHRLVSDRVITPR